MASTEVATIDTGWVREPADAPSARFGWHGVGRKSIAAAALIVGLILLGMLKGNHVGHVEDIYLVIIAVAMIGYTVYSMIPRKGAWKR
ncbi:DUF2631 domain-containing protein [Gordonia hydrophobica]|uniref:DUF2631 domain-containing protein n=1 Tax=Gordonia hydrophobica TaxID=40516 RepID=A0ABZ2U121_9ACTN|nr:DUF2631 domain-containing protein [Gordonia hydrophobica]MBM7367592.1 hypothetical protein [Gordonia hydrophobica]